VAHLLKVEHIGAVVVSEDGARVLGILSERDIVHGLVAHGADVLDKHAADLMTREVTTCRRGDDLKRVMALMTRQRVRHLPVVEAGVLEGLVSIGDVVKKRLEETETEAPHRPIREKEHRQRAGKAEENRDPPKRFTQLEGVRIEPGQRREGNQQRE